MCNLRALIFFGDLANSFNTRIFFPAFFVKGLGLFAVPGRDPEKILLRQAGLRLGGKGGVTGKGGGENNDLVFFG